MMRQCGEGWRRSELLVSPPTRSATEERVRVGVVVHDIGKTRHSEELHQPGKSHESAGERLLLERGWPSDVARICRLHGDWSSPECELEELAVALSDTLWKGKRVDELESLVVDRVAAQLRIERWAVFTELDSCFEEIASRGDERLGRSVDLAGR